MNYNSCGKRRYLDLHKAKNKKKDLKKDCFVTFINKINIEKKTCKEPTSVVALIAESGILLFSIPRGESQSKR